MPTTAPRKKKPAPPVYVGNPNSETAIALAKSGRPNVPDDPGWSIVWTIGSVAGLVIAGFNHNVAWFVVLSIVLIISVSILISAAEPKTRRRIRQFDELFARRQILLVPPAILKPLGDALNGAGVRAGTIEVVPGLFYDLPSLLELAEPLTTPGRPKQAQALATRALDAEMAKIAGDLRQAQDASDERTAVEAQLYIQHIEGLTRSVLADGLSAEDV